MKVTAAPSHDAADAILARPPQTSTVAGIIRSAAAACPDRPAVVGADGAQLGYADMLRNGEHRASALIEMGVKRGDRIAVWMDDCPAHVEAYVMCALGAFAVVPINARFTEHEALSLLEDSGARVLVYSEVTRQRAEAVLGTERSLVGVSTCASGYARFGFEELLECRSRLLSSPSPTDLFIIGYTSGTTGVPKGAILTQGSVATVARMNALSYRLPLASRVALTGSMSFVAVVPAHVISHFYVKGTVRLLGRWDVGSLIDVVESDAITFTYVPSPLLVDFTEAASERPEALRSLVTVLHSASKVPAPMLRGLADVAGGRLVEGLGMTENSGGLVTVTVPSDLTPRDGRDLLATVGRAVADVHIALVDAARRKLPHDGQTIGELVFASPALMSGYWNRPDATKQALVNGWYYSGDLGTVDPDGYVEVVDRRVDLIVSGGMNVYPSEIEQCIARMPGVSSCAVVGLPHERWGHTVVAAVVRASGATIDEAAVIDHCRRYLASYKKPTRVVFLEEMPMTYSLKVTRHAVRQMLSDGWLPL